MEDSLKLKKATYHLWTLPSANLFLLLVHKYIPLLSVFIFYKRRFTTSFAANLICNILPRTLAAPFAGYIVDKYPRKIIAITAQIATTLAIAGLLVVTLTSGLSFWQPFMSLHASCHLRSIFPVWRLPRLSQGLSIRINSKSDVIESDVDFVCGDCQPCGGWSFIWCCFDAGFSNYVYISFNIGRCFGIDNEFSKIVCPPQRRGGRRSKRINAREHEGG